MCCTCTRPFPRRYQLSHCRLAVTSSFSLATASASAAGCAHDGRPAASPPPLLIIIQHAACCARAAAYRQQKRSMPAKWSRAFSACEGKGKEWGICPYRPPADQCLILRGHARRWNSRDPGLSVLYVSTEPVSSPLLLSRADTKITLNKLPRRAWLSVAAPRFSRRFSVLVEPLGHPSLTLVSHSPS